MIQILRRNIKFNDPLMRSLLVITHEYRTGGVFVYNGIRMIASDLHGTFCIIHDGKVIVERPVSGTRFMNIMLKRGTQRGMPSGARSARGGSHG